jgi:hypothetical protein
MTLGLIVQIILGYVANALYDPNRTVVPPQDWAHWSLGFHKTNNRRILVLLGIINIPLGLHEFSGLYSMSVGLYVVYGIWVAGVIIVFLVAKSPAAH